LLKTDKKKSWNVLMHSAKCGDATNLRKHREHFRHLNENEELRSSMDWANVDHKVKDIISQEIFNGEMQGVSNCGRKKRARAAPS
jgi:hypothetical protein